MAHRVDSIIIILGLTGSGKSTFINAAANTDAIPVGHGIESTTQSVCCATVTHTKSSRKILLIEAPAFTYEILSIKNSERQLLKWFDDTSSSGQRKLTGILYLGRISDPRMTISPLVHLEMFERILGKNFHSKIQLVTTMWNRTPHAKAESREAELRATQWRPLTTTGSHFHRFYGTSESAWKAIEDLLDSNPITQYRLGRSFVYYPQVLRSRLLSFFGGSLLKSSKEAPHPLSREDIYIAVMGISGCGKSSFINTVSGKNDRPIGHSLDPCTKEIGTVDIFCPMKCDRKIVLIDTPGLDDLNSPDPGGIRAMVQRLTTNRDKFALSGVIYLHRILNNRISATSLSDLLGTIHASELCQKDALPTTLFVTTMWDEIDIDKGNQYEILLRQQYSTHRTNAKLEILRHDSGRESAWEVLDSIIRGANTRFAVEVDRGLRQLVDGLLSAQPRSDDAASVEALGQRLAQLVSQMRQPGRSEDERRNDAINYEDVRSKLYTKLDALRTSGYGHMISDHVWRRATIQL